MRLERAGLVEGLGRVAYEPGASSMTTRARSCVMRRHSMTARACSCGNSRSPGYVAIRWRWQRANDVSQSNARRPDGCCTPDSRDEHPVPLVVTIRCATLDDAAAVASLAARTFEETFAADNRPEDMAAHLATAYGVTQQSAEIADADYATLLAFADGALAAFAQVRRKIRRRVSPARTPSRSIASTSTAAGTDRAWRVR